MFCLWYDRKLREEIRKFMSQVSDFAAKVNTDFASIKTGILALDAKITALQNSPGTISPADQALLDDIQKQSSALATAANTFPPTAPPAV